MSGTATNVTGVIGVGNGGTGLSSVGPVNMGLQSNGAGGMTYGACGGLIGAVSAVNGGTGTTTAFPPGSIVFAETASGTYTQDNANFFWDSTNHRLGIDTATPVTALQVKGAVGFGNDISACTAARAGSLRWTGSEFDACDGSGWGRITLQTVNDNTPNDFNFVTQSGVATASTITSNGVPLYGFTGTLSAYCDTGCTAIGINTNASCATGSGSYTWYGLTATGIALGNCIEIRQTSSASVNTQTSAFVTVGDTDSGVWPVTTHP